MTQLVRYEAARNALAEARRVDEVKDIRDKAVAMETYARLAKDRELMEHATQIRVHAEIRAGELLREMTKNKGSVSGKTGRKARPVLDTAPKLADLGITKTQSSRWQKLAALSKDEQQEKVEEAKRKTEAVINPTPRKTTPRKPPKAEVPSLPSAIDPLLSCLMRVRALVFEWLPEIPLDQWSQLVSELHAEVGHIEQVIEKRKAESNGDITPHGHLH